MNISELDTPALVIDQDIMERNINKVADYCRTHNLHYRPHIKSHKIPALAHMQIDAGACGITVAKIGEAEVMAEAGLTDILIAYPVVGPSKINRLLNLAEKIRISVSLDSEDAAWPIARAAQERGLEIPLLVEVDVGMHRCGLPPGQPAVDFAKTIESLPGVTFGGLMYYCGHIHGDEAQRNSQMLEMKQLLDHLLKRFDEAGLSIPVISGGSTPSLFQSHMLEDGVTEIRPGTSIFNDRNTLTEDACALEDCAARIHCTIVSAAVPDRMMIDAGSKTITSDPVAGKNVIGYGYFEQDPDLQLVKLNEEHGHIDTSQSSKTWQVGDCLTLLMNHICVCMNLQEEVYGVRGDTVETVWPVAARGKLR